MPKLYLSFRHRNETARKERERKQSTPPFPIRRTEEACEQRDSLTERDDPRDRKVGGGRCAKIQRAEEMVSLTVPKEQVEDKGRMVDSQC